MRPIISWAHEDCIFGEPVVLDSKDQVMAHKDAMLAIKRYLQLTSREIAEVCNVSIRTVEGWLQGNKPITRAMLVLRREILIKERKESK